MTNKQQLQQQLNHAQQQLMTADSMESKCRWGIRCDELEAGIADLSYSPQETNRPANKEQEAAQ